MMMKSVLLLAHFLLLLAVLTEAAYNGPFYFGSNCTITRNFTSNTPYQFNLATLLSSLSSQLATANTSFHNTTYGTNDAVYALFMCRGDVPSRLCHDCVQHATKRIVAKCPYNKEAIIWYEECMLRYSDRSFFSTLQTDPRTTSVTYSRPVSESDMEDRVLRNTVNDVAEEAAKSSGDHAKFAIKEANVSSGNNNTVVKTLYTLAQCTPDLSTEDCHDCLRHIIQRSLWSPEVAVLNLSFERAEIFYPTCNLMFGSQRFYYKDNAEPVTSLYFGSGDDSTDDVQIHLSHNCNSNKNFTAGSAYQINLSKLLSSLVSSSDNLGFYNTTVSSKSPSNTVYGLFMCRGDISPHVCHQCVGNASQFLPSDCQFSKEAILWLNVCMLRYSNHYFFSKLDTSPKFNESTMTIENKQDNFNQQLAPTLDKLVEEATKSGLNVAKAKKFFATEEASSTDTDWETLYTLAQCTPDLSTQDCATCLKSIVEEIKSCCLGKRIVEFMYPSCNMRFDLYPFYNKNNTVAEAPTSTPTRMFSASADKGKEEGQSRIIIIVVVVVLIVVSLMLFGFTYYILRRKRSMRYKAMLEENFGNEFTTLESLQFSLATVEAATNKFSHENRIGKGGFGEVYKGILSDGKEIAVKRLSKRSGQGVTEFKNEILLIAKLQHRNLVTLLGFCLEEQEKILVYEFVSNKSLDYFLFGSQRQRVLSWSDRYKIIAGIARGILYLHEHSRLKVIHRDLKPSNILLDDEMNPKISDFGMAKMVAISETEGSTNRIVGTYGYMSPEYAMLGQFSEKSDVFSFGVIILEIVSGKRNSSCHGSQHVTGLLSYAWKQWSGGNWPEILDSNLIELESYSEVIRCIQIGLLCVQENPDVRPTMNTVVQYLSNDSIQLPFPQEPAFFLHDRMDQPTIRGMESHSREHATNDSEPCSINEMSMSNFFPR